jgi:hypothetical protein
VDAISKVFYEAIGSEPIQPLGNLLRKSLHHWATGFPFLGKPTAFKQVKNAPSKHL